MMPKPLPYPEIGSDVSELHDKMLVYVIKQYRMSGISMVVTKHDDGFIMQVADWSGTIIDPQIQQRLRDDVAAKVERILSIVKHAKIKQSQWYFSDDVLVDVRKSIDSFVGPGLLRDLCGKIFSTQEIIKITDFGSVKNDAGLKGSIIKPARYRTIVRDDSFIPLYAIVG